jgi:hypothetical protein
MSVNDVEATLIGFPARFVEVSIRETVLSVFRTQTDRSFAAMAAASTCPILMTRPLRGSIRETVKSGLIAQTAPAPTAMWSSTRLWVSPSAFGSAIAPRESPVAGSSFEIVVAIAGLSSVVGLLPFPTHTAPAPAARSVGSVPVPKVSTRWVSGSIR